MVHRVANHEWSRLFILDDDRKTFLCKRLYFLDRINGLKTNDVLDEQEN